MAFGWERKFWFTGDSKTESFGVRVGVCLNRASRPDMNGCYFLSVRVSRGGSRRLFININGIRMSDADFNAMCNERGVYNGRFRRFSDIGRAVDRCFDKVCEIVDEMVCSGRFVLGEFKSVWSGIEKMSGYDITPYSLWEQVASSKSAGTEESYRNALKRFKVDMGSGVVFNDFSSQMISLWRERMIRGGLSKTTANIYLRTLRAILNEASRLGLVADTKQMFHGLSVGGRNSYNDRKEQYLTVKQWTLLWKFYETYGEGNELFASWNDAQKKDRMEALGMMLFMYLANGMNLRDVLVLRYDSYYFMHDKLQFRFIRQKVADRSGSKVIFPVLDEIRIIIERQGEKEKKDGLVFGYLKNKVRLNASDKESVNEIRRLTALYNSTIGDRMAHIASAVGLDVSPTPTWCRHSFASNLTQAGVPREYISASMAHSDGNTTENYIDIYSYEQMVEYNRRLLVHEKNDIMEVLKGLSNEEIEKIIKVVRETK